MFRTLIALAVCAATAVPANAGIKNFTGHFSNDTPTPMADASCSIGQVLVHFDPGDSTAAGTSNLGAFGPSQTHCLVPGHPYTGTFSFAFADGTLTGTTAGHFSPTPTVGVANSFVTYTATGGTGEFAGASGSINGVGLLDKRPLRPLNDLTLGGVLNLPAVPEPGEWAMLIGGLGIVGTSMRRQRLVPETA